MCLNTPMEGLVAGVAAVGGGIICRPSTPMVGLIARVTAAEKAPDGTHPKPPVMLSSDSMASGGGAGESWYGVGTLAVLTASG